MGASGPRVADARAGQDHARADGDRGDSGNDRGSNKLYKTQEDIDRLGRDRLPQDQEITDPYIMVIDEGAPVGPMTPRFAMSKLQPGESLRTIRPYEPAGDKGEAKLALCKIVNRQNEYKHRRELKAQKRADAAAGKTKTKTKALDISWSITEHDLDTKLKQMGGFLKKGFKVEVKVERKRGGKKATRDEATTLLRKLRAAAEELGGTERREATGGLLQTMSLVFEVTKTPAGHSPAQEEDS